jgi:hypothetical protein
LRLSLFNAAKEESSSDNDFAETILRQEKPVAAEISKQIFDLAIAIGVPQGIISRFLNLHNFTIAEMISAESRAGIAVRMEESQHKPTWSYHLM